MIPFIIINGKSSKDVDGLIIQSLPPITKPMLRTEREEIDGRDGDIITKLGYSSYDKTFTIGLKGTYNIDDVIEFLNQDGTIIFSNEMDKYYNFQMLEQIDFEKLLKFKTAEVTIHVQPFKFSVADKEQSNRDINLLNLINMSFSTNGVSINVSNLIKIQGSHSVPTEVYIPINLTLNQGNYKLIAKSNNNTNCKLRMITSSPISDHTFGGSAITLGGTVTQSASLTTSKTYKYIWLYLEDNATENFDLTVGVYNTAHDGELILFNRGNIYSRPTLYIEGSGDIDLYLNGNKVLEIALGTLGHITINCLEMNAYKGDTFLNRYVTGDYNNIKLNVGNNVISWSGDLSLIEATYISRWI